MIPISGATRIYLYNGPCDMRKSFDGLCGMVRSELGADPLSGSLFVFCNRRRTMVKVLYWDRPAWRQTGMDLQYGIRDWSRAHLRCRLLKAEVA